MNWLNATIPYAAWIDSLRFIAILAGGMAAGRVVVMVLTAKMRTWTFKRAAGTIAFAGTGLVAVLQETQQLGKPMVIWRLPLLLVVTVASFFAVWGGDEHDSMAPLKEEYRRTKPGGSASR